MTAWNENNLLPLMEKRNARLLEYTVKDAIKTGNKNLTPEQRDEIYKAFTTKPDAFKKALKSLDITSGDSLLDWTYEDFQTRILSQLNANAGKNARTGIEGLVEGKDYIELGRGEEYGGWVAYLLLSFKGDQTLATNRVEPKIRIKSSNSKEMVEKATWCTAANAERFFSYACSNYLVDLFRFDPKFPDREKKIQFSVEMDSFKVTDILNAQNDCAKGITDLRKFIGSSILPVLRKYQDVASKAVEDELDRHYAPYFNPNTSRYDLPIQELVVFNDEIPVPIGVLTGKGIDAEIAYFRLANLQNFPREIRNSHIRLNGTGPGYMNQSGLLSNVRLDHSRLNISDFSREISINNVAIENESTLILSINQYLSLDPKEGQYILDSFLGLPPDSSKIRTFLSFDSYMQLKDHGYKLPEVKNWISGDYASAGGELLSGYTFKQYFYMTENRFKQNLKTTVLEDITAYVFQLHSAPPVKFRNVKVGFRLWIRDCEYITSLEGISAENGRSISEVGLKHCPNLADISSLLKFDIGDIFVVDCPKIKDIVIERFGKDAYHD